MAKKNSGATVSRNAKTGSFNVRSASGVTKTTKVSASSTRSIAKSSSKNRDALKRLADR